MMTQQILMVLNDQGGGVIQWNYDEISPALREQMKHHEPTIVIRYEGTANPDREKVLRMA